MNARLDTLRQILLRFGAGLVLATALFWLTLPAQSSRIAFISYHSLLSFLAVAAAALAFLSSYRSPSSSKNVLFVALLFRCFIHFGIALVYSFTEPDLSLANAPIRAYSDILSVCIFGIVFLMSCLLEYQKNRMTLSFVKGILLLFLLLSLYGLGFFFILQMLSPTQLEVANLFLTILTMGLFASSIVILLKIKDRVKHLQIHYLIAALLSFLIMPLALFGYSMGFYTMWTMAIYEQALGFSLLYLSIGEPLYDVSKIGKKATEAILSFLLALSVAPFALSLFSEAYAPGIILFDIGAYLISHSAAALLSAMMSILLFVYFKRKPRWNLLPLMVMYLSWTLIEIMIMLDFLTNFVPGIGESTVPYIFGGVVSLLVVYRGIMFTNQPPKDDPTKYEYRWVITRFIAVSSGILAALLIENRLQIYLPTLAGFPLGRVVLMLINLLALFGFSILLYITTRKFADWKSIEGIAIISLAFFIVPGILKGVFLDWSIGWWLGELVILFGLGVGPPLLGTLYVDSMSKAQDAQRRATLYSDLLVHDITNMHQAILVALSILEADLEDDEKHSSTIKDAKRSLDRASEIVASVRQIGLADQTNADTLHDVDIVNTLFDAFSQIRAEHPNDQIDFTVNRLPQECYTKANGLLMDLFYNLFRNSVKYSNDEKRIDITLKQKITNGQHFWNILVEDYGKGIEESRKKQLFQRFMKGAEGIGLGLSVVLALAKSFGGFVEVMDRIPGDHSKGTIFLISLPVSFPSNMDIT
ncbi:MAG: sensor histidine kinase [Candidatus Thorarchaeota archaeon]